MSNLHRPRRQLYNARILQYLLDNRKEIDRTQLSHLLAIQDKTKGLNEFEVAYDFKTAKMDKDCRVAMLGYGRIYGPIGSAEYLDNTYRHNLYADTEHDIDIRNCHPTLLIQLAQRQGINLPQLRIYVENREEYLREAMDYYKRMGVSEMTRADMKTMLIATLYGAQGTIFDPIRVELDYLTNVLKAQHPTLFEVVDSLKQKNKNGAFLAYIAQTEERKCLQAMDAYFFTHGRSVDALAYDGLMIRKESPDEIFPEELLRRAEAFVLEQTGYEIHLEIKPMEKTIDEKKLMTKEEKEDATYETMKQDFESNHFYFESTNTIIRKNANGSLQHFELRHARVAFNGLLLGKNKQGKPILFIDKWIEDPSRKIIRDLVMKMPHECADDEYSLFQGFDYQRIHEKVEPEDEKEFITMFQDLVMANSGDEETVYNHVMNGFAHMIQRPFEKMGILTAFATPDQGTGKDTLMLIISKVIGPSHTAHYTSTEQYWDKHDTLMEGAIFVYLEEACARQNKEREGQLKSRITSSTLNCNPKGVKGYSVPNVANQYMTTNDAEPFKITEQDRRGFLIKPSSRLKDQDWNRVYDMIKRPAFIQTIGHYLEQISLAGWRPNQFPETQIKTEMKLISKTSEHLFMEQWNSKGKWVLGRDLYRTYKTFCEENELPFCHNVISFCKKLAYDSDKTFQSKKGGKGLLKYASLDVKTEPTDEEEEENVPVETDN